MAGRQFLTEFIELYESLPCLWKVKTKEYGDRRKKEQAYALLISKYKEYDPAADRTTVTKKINGIRTVYKKELAKVYNSWAAEGELYKPSLWYFDLLHFLNNPESARPSRSLNADYKPDVNLVGEERMPEEYEQMVDADESVFEATECPPKRFREDDNTQQISQDFVQTQTKRDVNTVFGEYVQHKLQNCNRTRLEVSLAQRYIQDILFRLDAGLLAADVATIRTTSTLIPNNQLPSGIPLVQAHLTNDKLHPVVFTNQTPNSSSTSVPYSQSLSISLDNCKREHE